MQKIDQYSYYFLLPLLAALPIFLSEYPPMVDVPQHAAQVGTLIDLLQGQSEFSNLLRINWFTPYLLGYLLIAALTPIFGILMATKLIIAGSMAAFPLATGYFLNSIGSERRLAWLTLPTLYGFAFHWGFLNFIVAAPIGLLILSYGFKYNNNQNKSSGIILSILFIFLFFCHALICLFIMGIFGLNLITQNLSIKEKAFKLVTIIPTLFIMTVWGVITRQTESQVHWPIDWDLGMTRITNLPTVIFGTSSITLSLIGFACILSPLLAGFSFSKKLNDWSCFIVYLLVIFIVPNLIFGNFLTYQRFGLFLVPCLMATLNNPNQEKPKLSQKTIIIINSAIISLWLGILCLNIYGFNKEAQNYKKIISHADDKKRLLQLVFIQDSLFSPMPVYLHFGSWYQAEHHGLVDYSFSLFPVQLVRYQNNALIGPQQGFEWMPNTFNWIQHHGAEYDYFLVRSPIDLASELFKSAPHPPKLIAHSGGWWIYQQNSQ